MLLAQEVSRRPKYGYRITAVCGDGAMLRVREGG